MLSSVNFQTGANCKEVSFLLYSRRFHVLNSLSFKICDLQLYFAFGTDFKMLIFNEHMRLIRELPLKNRMIQFACFHEEESQIITAGIDGCYINNIKILSKYEPKQSMMLDPDGKNMTFEMTRAAQLSNITEWVKGLKIDTVHNLIIAWDQESVCFY